MIKNLASCSLVCCFGLLLSCTVNIEPKPALTQPPLIDQYPLKIGFFHSDQLKEYCSKNETGDAEYNYLLADASATFADNILKAMFRSVLPLNNISAINTNLDGAVGVEIEKFLSPWENSSFTVNQAKIVYAFTLYDNKNLPLGVLRVQGIGTSDQKYFLYSMLQDAAELAMKDAMAQFMVGFAKHPPFKNWLNAHGVATESPHER